MKKNKFAWTIKLSIIGMLFLVFNFFIIGGGHGYFEPLFISYPIPCFALIFFDEINFIVLSLLLIQFPIYGYILDNNIDRIKMAGLIILIIHLILGIIALQYIPSGFK